MIFFFKAKVVVVAEDGWREAPWRLEIIDLEFKFRGFLSEERCSLER